MMLLEVYYTIRFLKWHTLSFLCLTTHNSSKLLTRQLGSVVRHKSDNQNQNITLRKPESTRRKQERSKKKARRKQKDFLTLYIGCHFRVIPGSGVVLPGSSRKCMPPVLYLFKNQSLFQPKQSVFLILVY